ncbi:hypothetical protein CPB86DRAFT_784163 [Serendipita vermifera]|nr:hypothetical protein CPB86DRAFT_784163 [Serendipita vermifera]
MNLYSGLPDAPRYVILAYKPPSEGFARVILIDWIPTGCEPASSMLHVGTLPVIEKLIRPHKVSDPTDAHSGIFDLF